MDVQGQDGGKWLRRVPILLMLLAALAGVIFLRDHLGLEALARHRDALIAWREGHALLAPLAFVAAYALIVALSLPGATVATLAGGLLFGLFPGVVYNVAGASIGAVVIFLAARAGFGADLAQGIAARGGAAARLQAGLRDNEWPVLLMMRLVPVVPFFVANLIPAFVGVRLLPFAVTTVVGIIPGALVFTSVGSGLAEVLASGARPDLSVIFSAPVLLPILGLAALSGLPLLLKLIRKGPAHDRNPL